MHNRNKLLFLSATLQHVIHDAAPEIIYEFQAKLKVGKLILRAPSLLLTSELCSGKLHSAEDRERENKKAEKLLLQNEAARQK